MSSFRLEFEVRDCNHRVDKLLRSQREGEDDQSELPRLFKDPSPLEIPNFENCNQR